jgi:S-layer protein
MVLIMLNQLMMGVCHLWPVTIRNKIEIDFKSQGVLRMATAATRTSIINLVVLATNQAPGTTKLTELIALSDAGQSLAQIAATLTSAVSFTQVYPTFATNEEFAAEYIGNIIPAASAAVQTLAADLVASLLNGGATRADIVVASAEFLATAPTTDPSFGSAAATFQNKAAVALFHTVTLELDTGLDTALAGVTEDPTSVDEGKNAIDPSVETPAEVTAATAASVAAAAAATEAQTAADAAVAAAVAATPALAATNTTYVDALATANMTDAVALKVISDASTTASTAAAAAQTTADAAVVTAQASLATAAAIVPIDVTAVNTAQATLTVAEINATTATTAAATAATTAATDLAATTAADTADAALATATTALEAAGADTALAAAVTSTATAATDAAAAFATAAAATNDSTDDDTASAAAVAAAAASATAGTTALTDYSAAADAIALVIAQAALDVTATTALTAYNTAATASAAAITASTTANTAADTAFTTASAASASIGDANAAVTAAAAAVTAAAAAKVAADAEVAAAAALATATAATTATADDAGSTAATTAAAASLASATALVTAADADVAAAAPLPGTFVDATFALTIGVDNYIGVKGVDTITGSVDANTAANNTLSALDSINGGAGPDVFNINGITALDTTTIGGLKVSNVETVNAQSAVTLVVNSTAWTGTTALNVLGSIGDSTVTAASTTAVSVAGVTTGKTQVTGGSSATVTQTFTNATTSGINVDGVQGDVAITVTGSGATASGINAGATTQNTGAITVLATGATDVVNTPEVLDAIAVTGGTTISVTQVPSSNSSAIAAGATANDKITQGAVTVTAGNTTTSVTVIQADNVTVQAAVPAVAAIKEIKTVTFIAMLAAETVTVDGLIFTAAKNLTAAEVAGAFADLAKSDRQGSGVIAEGSYTVTTSANWTSGAVTSGATTSTVQFSEVTATTAATTLTVADTIAAGNVTVAVTTVGQTVTAGKTGRAAIETGAVVIDDNATASITDITVDGYASAVLGGGATLDKLTNLTLSNSTGNATVTTAGTLLNLNVSDVDNQVSLDGTGATVETLNIATGAVDSTFGLVAAAVKTLNISGGKKLDIDTGSTLSALATVVSTASGTVSLPAAAAATITSINTSGGTGSFTASINPTTATYTGGAGKDNVTTTAVAPTKAIATGAGDDTVTLFGGTTAIGTGGSINGGDGTSDTVSMVAADAVTASGSAAFKAAVTNFERLTLTGATKAQAVDVDALGYSYVTVAGITDVNAAADTLTLNKMASGGTLAVTGVLAAIGEATDGVVVAVTNAGTGLTDSLNIAVQAAAGLAAGRVTVASVETIHITPTDVAPVSLTTGLPTLEAQSLTLVATAATAITINTNTGFTLVNTGNVAVASINGSSSTGGITVTAAGTVASTITGGSGADVLTASTATSKGDTLVGGAGNDTLTGNSQLTSLTGGTGNDTFVIATPASNVNAYSSIKDFVVGDIIDFDDAATSLVKQADLGVNAVFQDYANAAINTVAAEGLAWFQFNGNTYIVHDDGVNSTVFTDSQDVVVELVGLIDLSKASFNATTATVELTA